LINRSVNGSIDARSVIEPEITQLRDERSHWYEAEPPTVIIDMVTVVASCLD
jgi:hypothetical protein